MPEKTLPDSWFDMIETYSRQKPAQAKKLNEAMPLEYGAKRISVLVNPETMAGYWMTQPDAREYMRQQMKELFDFTGELIVKEMAFKKDKGTA